MSDRKAELLRKKAKLDEIRESKKRRGESKRPGIQDGMTSEANGSGSNVDLRQTTEELLKDLGISAVDESTTSRESADVTNHPKSQRTPGSLKKRRPLQVSEIVESSIPPPQSVAYNKEVQTIEPPNERENRPKDYYVLTYEESNRDEEQVDANAALAELQKMPHVGLNPATLTRRGKADGTDGGLGQKLHGEDEAKKVLNLSEEEKASIMASEHFLDFFDRASRVVERALDEPDDELFFDYSGTDHEEEKSHELLTVCQEFMDDRWSKRRTCTSLEWSTIFPELLLAAYHVNEDAVHEPEGVCLMWNMKYGKKTGPEYIFHCQSPVTAATLSKFHPNLVFGGTYSGQVVLWDSRVNKRTPVQRSPLSSEAHTHPVFGITVVGTQNAHHVISLASDGSMCAWGLETLAQPREKGKVCEIPSSGMFDLYPTCMSFFANDVNNYAVGAENGNAFCGQRHSSGSGSVAESSRHIPYKGHCAPISAISTHPSPGAVSFSSLFLTSSLDWTVRLWSTREHKPLHTFEDYFDYVYDVCWSPVHPAVFAAADGMGRLDVWNINSDIEVPCARRVLHTPVGPDKFVQGQVALNKCRFNASGTHLAAGDNQGRVTVCTVHESLSQPGPEQWPELAHSLADMRQYNVEQEVRAEM